ncbi:hypothetical protein OEZ85_005819 [Tetradesmus obliquus]|uniref:SET domain-containing protein n=1 Tax=Tetradesmus obliquus TaxID=3088 RepID=A0ABY8UEK5_TETOB|nr:hypothetical protein OEZ85_005819 [Tetradesmus obliquus]
MNDRHIGPVEVSPPQPGRGRGVVAREDLQPGSLLFVSEPVGSVLEGQLGQQLQPQHLLQHWKTSQQGLSAEDRVKLSLLHRPSSSSSSSSSSSTPPPISFKDFSTSKASSKAKKASAKGFGAAPAKQAGNAAAAAAAAVELTDEQLEAVVACNAYGDDHTDATLTYCRQEQQRSVIGLFPEFSLLNHSCAPNTAAPVLLRDRLLLRTAVVVPAGQELTTSYLSTAGGMPRQQRQQLLQQHYGFVCGCHRCKAEEQAAPDITATLQAMHAFSSSIDAPQLLQLMAINPAEEQAAPDITATLQAMHAFSSSIDAPQLLQLMAINPAEEQAAPDITATLQAMHAFSSSIDAPQLLQLMAAAGDEASTAKLTTLHQQAGKLVQQLEDQLQQHVTEPVVAQWLRASGYDMLALMLRTGEFLAGVKDVAAAKRLAELVRVFAPASEPHLLLLSDSAVRAAEAAAAGGPAPTAPEDTQELRVAQLVRALALRYGEPRDMDLLTTLAGALSASLTPHWLGLIDLDGAMGLQQLMQQLAAAGSAAAGAAGSDGGGSRRKVEMDASQLGQLQ